MFFFNDTATTEIYTLSLHDALPICRRTRSRDMGIISWVAVGLIAGLLAKWFMPGTGPAGFIVTVLIGMAGADRKSTRLNSSHANISYAVFCLKKRQITYMPATRGGS